MSSNGHTNLAATSESRDALTAGREPHDSELMARATQGDSQAFADLFTRHRSAALGVARRACRDHALAEDVLQETFISVWRNRGAYRSGRGSVRGWILAIAHNRAIDMQRRTRRHPVPTAGDQELLERQVAPELTDAQAIARQQITAFRKGMRALPRDQAVSLELAYFHGYSQVEIGRLVDAPLGTVKGRIRLGLTKLQGDAELTGELAPA